MCIPVFNGFCEAGLAGARSLCVLLIASLAPVEGCGGVLEGAEPPAADVFAVVVGGEGGLGEDVAVDVFVALALLTLT